MRASAEIWPAFLRNFQEAPPIRWLCLMQFGSKTRDDNWHFDWEPRPASNEVEATSFPNLRIAIHEKPRMRANNSHVPAPTEEALGRSLPFPIVVLLSPSRALAFIGTMSVRQHWVLRQAPRIPGLFFEDSSCCGLKLLSTFPPSLALSA